MLAISGLLGCSVPLSGCGTGHDLAGTGATSAAPSTSPATLSTTSSPRTTSSRAVGSSRTPVPPSEPPPYIEYIEWVATEVGPSLQIHPTPAGRVVRGDGTADTAWAEVLALEPEGDAPGMRAQFDCHWTFARIVEPDKPSWNLEPGRPVVSDSEMIAARCNPGFAEES